MKRPGKQRLLRTLGIATIALAFCIVPAGSAKAQFGYYGGYPGYYGGYGGLDYYGGYGYGGYGYGYPGYYGGYGLGWPSAAGYALNNPLNYAAFMNAYGMPVYSVPPIWGGATGLYPGVGYPPATGSETSPYVQYDWYGPRYRLPRSSVIH
ncbi:MAG TPA: hypothetical protein VGY53_04440 [Isosphaeraceae bacterium]|jgi:hypothetical protein|nr:hypothetical protein [Isosphaeraceae bacterium]